MRIFINALSLSNTYGIGRYTRALLQGLERVDRRGFEISVFLRRGDEHLFKRGRAFRFFFPNSLNANRLFVEQFELPSILARLRPQVYFSPDFTLPIICKARLKIVTVHDFLIYTYPESVSLRARALYRSFIPSSMVKANLVFVDSDYTRRKAIEMFDGAEIKTIVLYPALDDLFINNANLQTDQTSDGESLAKHSIKLKDQTRLADTEIKKPFLLYVGSNSSRKNLRTLTNRFVEVKQSEKSNCSLLLVGGDGAYNMPDYGIYDVGFQADEVIIDLYRNALGLCLISSEEGFGYPVAEALSFGCPALITRNSAMSEISENGKGIVQIDPANDKEVKDGLIRMIDDNISLRNEIDREVIINKFSPERLANEFIKHCSIQLG